MKKQLVMAGLFLLLVAVNAYQDQTQEQLAPPPEPVAASSPSPMVQPDVAGVSTATDSAAAATRAVVSVTDGDTIKVIVDGKTETVRIVGINTPETVDPRKPVECFGQQASSYLKTKLLNQSVYLEVDETQMDRDRYGRLLRFVFLTDGTDVGLEMIKEGYARESLYSDVPHKYHESYLAAQAYAQRENRGLWNPSVCLSQ